MPHQQQGFSLIELIVVIIITGILAGIAIPRLFQSMDAAHDAAVQKFAGEFGSGLKSFRSDYIMAGNGKSNYLGFEMNKTNKLPMARSSQACLRIAEQIGGLSGDTFLTYLLEDSAQFEQVIKDNAAGNPDALIDKQRFLVTYYSRYTRDGMNLSDACLYAYLADATLIRGIVYHPTYDFDRNERPISYMTYDVSDVLANN